MPETAMAVARTTPCEQREEDMVDESRWELEQSMLCDLLQIVRSIGVLFLGVVHIAVCVGIFFSLLPIIYKGH